MDPLELYTAHEPKARQVVQGLCHHYQYSGAFAFQDDANSHALIALWKSCVAFDPKRQVFQRRQEALKLQTQADEIVLACMFNYEAPAPIIIADPYATFWISSIQRVRGAVLDFFRAERIITKTVRRGSICKLTPHQVKKLKNRIVDWDDEEALIRLADEYNIDPADMNDLRPTMLYQDRFISMSQLLSESCDGYVVQNQNVLNKTYGDCLASEARADSEDERWHLKKTVETLRDSAELTPEEQQALDLCYSEYGYTEQEVADMLGVSRREIEKRLGKAYSKMRAAAGQPDRELAISA